MGEMPQNEAGLRPGLQLEGTDQQCPLVSRHLRCSLVNYTDLAMQVLEMGTRYVSARVSGLWTWPQQWP